MYVISDDGSDLLLEIKAPKGYKIVRVDYVKKDDFYLMCWDFFQDEGVACMWNLDEPSITKYPILEKINQEQ